MPSLAGTNTTQINYADTSAFDQISGFYGPGSWAAWMLAAISSLCLMRKRPDNHTILSMIPPSLYVNWAAVDLLKQVHSAGPSLETFVSAFGITFWGLWYFFCVSYILCGHWFHGPSLFNGDSLIRRVLCILTLVGSCIPCIAMTAGLHTMSHRGEMSFQKSPRTTARLGSELNMSDELAFQKSSEMNMYGLVIIIATIYLGDFCMQQIVTILRETHYWPHPSLGVEKADRKFISMFVAVMLSSAILLVFILLENTAYHWWLVTDINGDRTFCLLRPCGPQSLTESDQGFSLCCGLTLFSYEIGRDFLYWVARVGKTVGKILKGFYMTVSRDLRDIYHDPWTFSMVLWDYVKGFWVILDAVWRPMARPARVVHWPGSGRKEQTDLEERWKELSSMGTTRRGDGPRGPALRQE